MNFTYPFFLWGLLALAIPVIIHLFNFRKAKKIQFSNVSILESIKKKSASNLKLRQVLILISRMLFVLFLVLTFAQPFIPSTQEGLQGKSVVFFVDNSSSMSNLTTSDFSSFNEALTIADQIVRLYPEETAFHLYSNDLAPSANNQRTKAKTLEKLTELESSTTTRSGDEIFIQMQSNQTTNPKDVFILSDFQSSTIGKLTNIRDSLNTYHLIPITAANLDNIAVDTLFLSNPFLIPNQKNFLHVRLKNDSDRPVNDLSIKLFVNDQRNATANIDIDPHAVQEVQFSIPTNILAINACKISFEDFPVAFDNEYYFTLNQISKIKLVEVIDHTTNSNKSYLSKVFQDNPLFDIVTFDAGNIAYQTLEKSDVLIVNAVIEPSAGLTAQIAQHLQKGKTVIYIPAAHQASAKWAEKALGMKVEYISSTLDTDKVALKTPDIDNPFFQNIFESVELSTKMPNASIRLKWFDNSIPILLTKTGEPYLSHLSSKGNLYLFASPFSDQHTDFHKHALFVPVMQRIAELSSTNSQVLAYAIGNPNVTIAVDSIPTNQLYKLIQGRTELIPSQRFSNNQLLLNIPKYLMKPGHYDLKLGDTVVNIVSFNSDKRESDLMPLSDEELAARLSGISNLKIFNSVDAKTFSAEMKDRFHSRELWKYALILCLIFLLIESALIRYLK